MSQPQPTTDPFERYTDRANTVIALAHSHAQRLRRDDIDTEHLLLAITDAGNGTAAMALAALRVSLDDIRRETQARARAGQSRPGKAIRFAESASAVLDRAQQEADTMGHQYVGTDHLMLALTAQTGSVAAQVLASLGVNGDRLRAQVIHLLNAYTPGRQTGDEPTPEQVVSGRRFALPAALSAYNDDIAEARWQKELAGAHIDIASVDWFADQLRELAALAPDTADNQLHGVFVATRPNDETTRWLVRNRQVVTVPGDPYQEHLGT